ncbi:hypothetical protein [Cellulomonas sp. PhB143]|uniref:hypothetical protein n=1 Tax=Cellulomonas sp. PhB143 TaxID=2485186 RepID=UPI000FA3798B|nr:hypothetical protein [Cellulomonas sp. PhB143]ROS79002.1 hypothetical protein EDF32_0185 [Cellulomonas sp. PhB143]
MSTDRPQPSGQDDDATLPLAGSVPETEPLAGATPDGAAGAPASGPWTEPAPAPAADATRADGPAPREHTERRAISVATVVWGLVLALVGAMVLALAGGADVDLDLAVIVVLAAGGLALLVGSVVAGVRRSGRQGRAGR